MSGPLAGTGGKPLLGREGSDKRYVGRVIIELYEGPHIASDMDGLVMSISPAIGSNLSQQELLSRIAVALPSRAASRAKANPEAAGQ
jgi:hypothetical protein